MSKTRVFELALECGMDSKALIDQLWTLGVIADGPEAELSDEMVAKARSLFAAQPVPEAAPTTRKVVPLAPARSQPPSPPKGRKAPPMIRVLDIAERYKMEPGELVARLASIGVAAEDHLSWLTAEDVTALEQEFARNPPEGRVTSEVTDGVKRRRRVRPRRDGS